MKVVLRNPRRELEMAGPMRVHALLDRLDHMDAKAAATDANWAEADAAEALDFADWAVGNAQLSILDAIHARAYADTLKAADAK